MDEEWIGAVRAQGGSDLYLVADLPPSIRVHGTVRPLPEEALHPEEIETILLAVLPPHATEQYRKTGSADASFRRGSHGRFRVNLQRPACGRFLAGAVVREESGKR